MRNRAIYDFAMWSQHYGFPQKTLASIQENFFFTKNIGTPSTNYICAHGAQDADVITSLYGYLAVELNK